MGKRNMTEYYTTRSLATAAAAIEQGFDGIEANTYPNGWVHCDKMKQKEKGLLDPNWYAWRFPKTPHNVSLMDGKEGDFVLVNGGIYSGYGQYKADYSGNLYIIRDELLRDIGSPPFNYTIIHRNNKPFPVWDKEEV